MRMGNLYGDVAMGLDFFDASINRVAAWVVGARSMEKALLYALLMPHGTMKELQDTQQFTKLMVMNEELKTMPFADVWEEYCRRAGAPAGQEWFDEIEKYEKDVLSKRG
jgi:L-rhamnose isomerase